jgi:hypothetical protein
MRLKKETQYRISHHPYPRAKLGRIKPKGQASGTIRKKHPKSIHSGKKDM